MINIKENLDTVEEVAEFLKKKYKKYYFASTPPDYTHKVISSFRVPVTIEKVKLHFYFTYYLITTYGMPVLEIGMVDGKQSKLSSEKPPKLAELVRMVANRHKFDIIKHNYASGTFEPSNTTTRQITAVLDYFIKEIRKLESKGSRV